MTLRPSDTNISSKDNTEKIEVSFNGLAYELSLNLYDSTLSIKLKGNMPIIMYEGLFPVKELMENGYCRIIGSVDDVMLNIIDKAKEKTLKAVFEGNTAIIVVSFFLDNKEKKLELPLIEVEGVDQRMMNKSLCEEVIRLRNEVAFLKLKLDELFLEKYDYSSMIRSSKEEEVLKSFVPIENAKFTIIFDTMVDSSQSVEYHKKCDGVGPTMVIAEVMNGLRFGGYTGISLDSSGTYKTNDNDACVFSLTYGKKFKCKNQANVIYCHASDGPTFGAQDIYLFNNCTQNFSSYSNFGTSYDATGITNPKTYLAGDYNFVVKRYVVYKVEKGN